MVDMKISRKWRAVAVIFISSSALVPKALDFFREPECVSEEKRIENDTDAG